MTDGIPPRRPVRRVHSGPGDKRPPPPPATPPARPSAPPTAVSGRGEPPAQASSSLSTEHAARLESELAAKATQLAVKARQLDDALATAARDGAARATAEVEQARHRADEIRSRTTTNIRAATETRRTGIAARTAELAAEAAPGPFGADFSGDWTAINGGREGGPGLVRRGASGQQAALYPLFHDKGWFLEGSAKETIHEIQAQVLRAVAGLPLKHLRIDVYDPRIEGKLGGFAPLRSAHAASFPAPTTSPSPFREVLEGVIKSAAANAEALATEHATTLGELWKARGVPSGEYRVVVVLNYPEGIDREAQNLLVRLARSGGPNGVTLLVQSDSTGEPADDTVRPGDLAQHLRKSRLEGSGTLLLSDYPTAVEVTPDGRPPATLVNEVIAAATARATSDVGPIIQLEELIGDDAREPWRGDGTDAVEATIGRVGQRPLSISLRSQNPPISNILVGGAVGQGKSNLLLDIIYALTSRYSPDDLELHLLDFKRGLEFQRFAADEHGMNWLPHAKVLSLESDRAFGVAVLRHVVRELEERARLFKENSASGIEDFRRRTGNTMPRLLLIVDEFQVLFDGDDQLVDEGVELLEAISRQGRASGVHLLLSSQTTTGVSGLRVKGESIFAQFPLRISLKNPVTESEAILSQGNKAAADLTYRGEIIVNRNFGHDPEGSNERAISAYADPAFIEGLQARLWERRPDGTGPLVFVSTAFAEWPKSVPAADPDGPARGLIGRPVAVTNEPVSLLVDEDVDQTVAIVGSDESLAVPVLAALTRSLGTTLAPNRVIVIDLTASSDEAAGGSIASVLRELLEKGVSVERFGRAGATNGLAGSVRSALADAIGRTLVIGIGWQRWTGIDDAHPVYPDDEDSFDTFSLREVIEELTQRGALRGVFFVGWWTTLRSVQDQLGFSYQGVRHFVTAKLGLDDYRSLTSHSEPGIEGYPRVGHIDKAADGGPSVVVPFAPPGTAS